MLDISSYIVHKLALHIFEINAIKRKVLRQRATRYLKNILWLYNYYIQMHIKGYSSK